MFDAGDPGPDYQLLWPVDLFRGEAAVLLSADAATLITDARLLLEEAFAGGAPRTDLTTATWPDMPSLITPWGGDPDHAHAKAFLAYLTVVADDLPQWSAPRPYWTRRHGRPAPGTRPSSLFDDLESAKDPAPTDVWQRAVDDLERDTDRARRLQQDWVRLVDDLLERGYLDKVAARDCVDEPQPSPLLALNGETQDRIGLDDLWPLRPGPWDEDLFYDLVEVVHDLVARPRHRWWHDYQRCGYHYSDFALAPGRAVYRWRVDQLLARHQVDLRLAASGEDTGRLVHVTGDARDELVQRALASPTPADQDAVQHAVALFRPRGVTRDHKRSAVVALARILEDRRPLIKSQLGKKDEGDLFTIANGFDLRHRNRQQQGDYDDAFLDWIFWWYLATVELTDRIIARQP